MAAARSGEGKDVREGNHSEEEPLFAALLVCLTGGVLEGEGGERAREGGAGSGAGGPVTATATAWTCLR
jgi:hypothetical protein